MKPGFISLLLIISTLSTFVTGAAEEVRLINTGRGVTLPILLVAVKKPVASVVLFPGGKGKLELSPEDGLGRLVKNFLVRSRHLFADQNLLVVVVDAPADRQTGKGLLGFRDTIAHAQDVGAVIKYIRRQYPGIPVWLVGTSRGSTSVANAAIKLQTNGPDGIVLTTAVTNSSKRGTYVTALRLKKIKQPTLVVHHKRDQCHVSPYSGAKRIVRKLKNATIKLLITVEGGVTEGHPCRGMAYHGFNGKEAETVKKITDWIKQQNR